MENTILLFYIYKNKKIRDNNFHFCNCFDITFGINDFLHIPFVLRWQFRSHGCLARQSKSTFLNVLNLGDPNYMGSSINCYHWLLQYQEAFQRHSWAPSLKIIVNFLGVFLPPGSVVRRNPKKTTGVSYHVNSQFNCLLWWNTSPLNTKTSKLAESKGMDLGRRSFCFVHSV